MDVLMYVLMDGKGGCVDVCIDICVDVCIDGWERWMC